MIRTAVCAAVLLASANVWAGAEVGKPAPSLDGALNADKSAAKPPGTLGRVTVVTFGASWCKPCKRELPALDKLAEGFKKRNVQAQFVAVNIDEKHEAGVAFMKGRGIKHMTVLYDGHKKLVAAYDPPKMPTTYVVTNGKVVLVHAGYESGDDARLMRVVNRQLGTLAAPAGGGRY